MSLVAGERLATKVGAVALLLAAAGVIFVAAVLPQLAGARAARVRVYYLELAGLKEGAPVRSAGEQIGRVEAIALSPAGAGGADSPLSGQAGAVVYLAIDEDGLARTWRGGAYVISSSGPLAARFVEVIPPRSERPEDQAPLVSGMALRGVDPPTLDRVLQRTWTNLGIARRFFEQVAPEALALRREVSALLLTLQQVRRDATASGAGPATGTGTGPASGTASPSPAAPAAGLVSDDRLAQLLVELGALAAEAELAWRDVVGGRPGLARLQAVAGRAQATWRSASASAAELFALIEALRAELARVQAQLAAAAPSAKLAALLAQLDVLGAKLAAVEGNARVIAERWQRREGTLGRLLSDPEFPEDAKELGKILKRQPWRIFGHPDDEAGRAPPARRGGDGGDGGGHDDDR